MAADLHIHVMEGVTEDDVALMSCNVVDSKYYNMSRYQEKADNKLYIRMSETPNIWIGEVSWLKAALFGDAETFVPDPVQEISDLIGEDLPVLTEELRDKILNALQIENTTQYRVASPKNQEIVDFLNTHLGKKLFTISW